MRFVFITLTFFMLLGTAGAEQIPVWIGMSAPRFGEAEGIYRTTLDTDSGALAQPTLAAKISSPGFLALSPDRKRLYSICKLENGEGGVAAFEIGADGKSLRQISAQPTGDGEPAHIALDREGRCLFSAQYGTGSVCAFPIAADGTIRPRSAIVRHKGTGPNKVRQESPHPHWTGTDPANKFLFVPDLGADQIVIYRIDLEKGSIEPHGAGRSPAGAGPRHLKFHPSGKFVYVINELDLSVTAYKYDADAGTLMEIQTISTLPEAARETPCSGSEIRMHPTGKFLYAANRGHDSIAAFKIDPESGKLTFIEREHIRGAHPRNFNIDPTGKWLIAAGRDTNTLSLFRIDADTGGLVYAAAVNSPSPICVEFGPGGLSP